MKKIFMTTATVALAMACAGKDAQPDLHGIFSDDVKTVGIVAVSSVIEPAVFNKGTNRLTKAGYRLKIMPNVTEQKVTSPERRARLLEQAWLDPEIDILLFARGGQGAMDVVDLIDWEMLRARDMRVIGFSDVTVIVNTMLSKKVGHPYSGPMLSSLRHVLPTTIKRIHDMLAGTPKDVKLHVVKAGTAPVKGLAMGGILDRIHRLANKGLLPDPAGRIIFIENTRRYSARTQEMLDDLRTKDIFRNAAAVVICSFNPDRPKEETDALLKKFAENIPCPVFAGFPYGHVSDSSLIDFRRELTITPDGMLSWRQGN